VIASGSALPSNPQAIPSPSKLGRQGNAAKQANSFAISGVHCADIVEHSENGAERRSQELKLFTDESALVSIEPALSEFLCIAFSIANRNGNQYPIRPAAQALSKNGLVRMPFASFAVMAA